MPIASSVIGQLGAVCREQGLTGVASRFRDLQVWMAGEMLLFEADLARLRRGTPRIQRSAGHLLRFPGKHVRPMCVALAAKLGDGFGPAARDLAVAVELIHNASLLHDDVIDLGESRRGAPTARLLYGNAASIIGGNWLLTTALQRVARAPLPGLLERTLRTVEEMIRAEALQLRHRGRVRASRRDYFRVLEGKTAALFRLALYGGARAGGLAAGACRALERFGAELGVAFQLVDDLLDVAGEAAVMGKTTFNDLREGKITYPLLLALERDRSLRPLVERALSRPADAPVADTTRRRVRKALAATGAVRDCRALARERTGAAVDHLAAVPAGPGRDALVALAEAIVDREA